MLTKKLFRTIGLYRAQFISMIIMIALGVGIFFGFNMEWYSLETDVLTFLRDTGYADYRIYGENGFTKEDLSAIGKIEGVERASRFFSVNVTVKDTSKILSLAVTEDASVSGFSLIRGDAYDENSTDGLWLSDRYAESNGVKVGETLTLVYKGIQIDGVVRGLVKAGEYLICLPDESMLMPDYGNYGFVYASPAFLERALGARFFTRIDVIGGADPAEFKAAANEALHKTLLILTKDETVSYAEAMGESKEGKTMCSVLPVLFLAIAVLTMVTTMHRLTASEKTQIGTLKALGFKDRRIAWHYTSYALFIALSGTLLGLLIGWGLGYYIMNPNGAMGTYLDMPDWSLSLPPLAWAGIALIDLLTVLLGYLSVKNMLRGTAADALRPYTPKRMRSLFIERFGFFARLSFGTKWNLRDSMRHKARTGMTLFGIIGCVLLLVGSLGMKDTMDAFIKIFYSDALAYENRINLDRDAVTSEDIDELQTLYDADRSSFLDVQIGDKAVGLEICGIERDLLRYVGEDASTVVPRNDGAYICKRIADRFSLSCGDTLTFSPFGSDNVEYTVTVGGVLRSMSESIVMTEDYARSVGIPFQPTTLYTAEKNVAPDARITSVQSAQSVIDSFDTFAEILNVMIVLLMLAAVILGIVVLYNLGVMSYTERYREMATLKVIGFKDRKIRRLLVGQNLALTVLGVLLGIPCGWATLAILLDALAGEYEMNLTLGPTTFIVSVLLSFGVSTVVALMVARKNKKINMVEALKTPE